MLFLLCVTTVALGWGTKDSSANHVEVGIGIGLSIATLAQAFGHVSGGHLNPAVTFGMVFGGRTPIIRGIFYIIAQLVGGMLRNEIKGLRLMQRRVKGRLFYSVSWIMIVY